MTSTYLLSKKSIYFNHKPLRKRGKGQPKKDEGLIQWLKKQRESSGLTMRDMCKQLDCSIGLVQKIESGHHRLDALQLVRYCEAIGADAHEGIRILEKN